MRTLCLGEALVDLVCHEPVAAVQDAPAFVPHFGGSAANVAVRCAREGERVALAGAAGDDAWGRWLSGRLAAEGVDLVFAHVQDLQTPLAFVTVDEEARPSYLFHGPGLAAGLPAIAKVVPAAVDACDALFCVSTTLVGEAERAITFAARDQARRRGRPLVVDANLRTDLWPTASRAVEETLDLARGAFLLKCNDDEARLLTGEWDLDRAAASLLAAGCGHVVITRGPDGAILRGGPMDLDVPGVGAEPVDTTGAGDAVTGVLLAALTGSGFYPPALVAALPRAVEVAARTTEHFGAI
jgi:sugar/nucleoside kinase (ribokinase family)